MKKNFDPLDPWGGGGRGVPREFRKKLFSRNRIMMVWDCTAFNADHNHMTEVHYQL